MNNYRSLLLEISNSLTTPDLQQLKFLCGDVISAGAAERITRGFELFSALEQRNMLSEENRDFLASKLIAIKRNDLRNKLLGIQGRNVLEQVNICWCHFVSTLVLSNDSSKYKLKVLFSARIC